MDKRKLRGPVFVVAALAIAFGLTRLPWRGVYQAVTGLGARHEEAIALARKSCGADDGSGCFILGYFYGEGQGGDRAESAAVAAGLYRKSCDLNDAMGCAALGDAYLSGSGVGLDLAKSAEFFRRSCDHPDGHAPSCRALSLAYERGEGVPKNRAKSVEYARKGAALHHKPGENKTMAKLLSILES